MKFFVASACALFALATAEYMVRTHDDLMHYREECVSDLRVPESLVEQYKAWEYPNDEITHCYMKCIFTKFGFYDGNGFVVENIHQQLMAANSSMEHEDMHTRIESCIDQNEQGSNACEWVYRGATCFIKNNMALVQESVAAPAEAVPSEVVPSEDAPSEVVPSEAAPME